MSRPASSRQSLAETLFKAGASASCQCSGLAALNDSSARRCLEAGSCSSSGPSFASCAQIACAVDFAFAGRQPGHLPHVVPGKDRFQRHRRLGALVAGDFGVQRGDDFRGRGRFVGQIVRVPEQLAGHGDAGLQSLGRPEFLQQPVLQGNLLRPDR